MPLKAVKPRSQGFWPDGIYLAPTYEAMKYDLQTLKLVNMNMVRKHIKVEPDLFYRACDEMGLLVIQDMPSMIPSVTDDHPSPSGTSLSRTFGIFSADIATEQTEWERQLTLLIEQHRSFPSIYTWIIYNEGWGQLPSAPELYLEPRVKSLDPTRLVDAVTGWNDHGAGDYSDNHHVSSNLFYGAEATVLQPSMRITDQLNSFKPV